MWKGSWGVLGYWGVSGQNRSDRFAKPVWPVSPACVRLSPTEAVWPVLETGLTGLGCQQPCRVCFRCVCAVTVGWVLLLSSVALQWLCELGKRSLRRCTNEIGFIGWILEYNFYRLPFTPPLSGSPFRSFSLNLSVPSLSILQLLPNPTTQVLCLNLIEFGLTQRTIQVHYVKTSNRSRSISNGLLWHVTKNIKGNRHH
jgi:hypothetical protein